MSDKTRQSAEAKEGAEAKEVNRRDFLRTTGVGIAAATAASVIPAVIPASAKAAKENKTPESIVKVLYEALSAKQKSQVCFDWDHQDKDRGLLRTRVAANWHITKPRIKSDFFTSDQQQMVRDIFEGMLNPDWVAKFDKQLQDDAGGWGKSQNIAIFGAPGGEKFEFVLTGRHMTMRCDGNSAEHVAFGGPIFYGHAAKGFNEKPNHPGNVFWNQALAANKVYEMLDGKQRKIAEVDVSPIESAVSFTGDRPRPGISVADLSSDQKEQVQKTLQTLVEMYRKSDQAEALACLKTQGGLDKCNLAFFTDQDIGEDKVWDNWRLEGPAFVWHFRGAPHVHTWVNISDDSSVKTNA